jgi:hypothetical protein
MYVLGLHNKHYYYKNKMILLEMQFFTCLRADSALWRLSSKQECENIEKPG